MPLFRLTKELQFPPVQLSEPDGLLAIGGDLSNDRLLLAYKNGIFPWYNSDEILWWSPDPRFVLFPSELKVSKSMRKLLQHNAFDFTIDKRFSDVIANCESITRKGQEGTWITEDIRRAYTALHEAGFAHSAEAWQQERLVGGLYGIQLGKVFFGESMFSKVTNSSKYVFIRYVEQLANEGVELIDCQVYTPHLESLGARMISRKHFLELIRKLQ